MSNLCYGTPRASLKRRELPLKGPHQHHAQTPNARQQVLTWREHSRMTPGRRRHEKDERRHSFLLIALSFSLARSACRLGSGWGVTVSESVNPLSSSSHADPSCSPPFAVSESVGFPSSSSHADPSCCLPFAVNECVNPPLTGAMLIKVVVCRSQGVDPLSSVSHAD
ncbi:uncharacterized protein F5891DRAFT_1037084 [Suillus fuscotomentosus]|uniref:Uncharacterized protein n=2 Tax=Suillus fuscotomentosus TaxID=1912939 RepID=A0AAD4E518_9AGAM|nr:uncharacterized protein F5891DRAFT_1037084 [Suillus fuscotomentosus]KAG1899860.1 hypothetical protein F5891DRAFT_1037084 [Suillus fuscotomentosus]